MLARHKRLAKKARTRRGSRLRPRILVSFRKTIPQGEDEYPEEESGWIDETGHSCVPDEYDRDEGLTAVDLAVKFMKKEGAGEASSSHFHKGIWYSTYPSQWTHDHFTTGTDESHDFHLKGFTEAQEREIFRRMTERSR